MLSQPLSHVNVVGIHLLHELGWTRSLAKTSPCWAGSSNSRLSLDLILFNIVLHFTSKFYLSVSNVSHDKSFSQLYKGTFYSFIIIWPFVCRYATIPSNTPKPSMSQSSELSKKWLPCVSLNVRFENVVVLQGSGS